MPARQVSRFYTRVGLLLLVCASAACDDGFVQLTLLSELDGGPDAGAEAGRGAAGATPGGRGGPGGESPAGAMSPRPPYPCEEVTELEQEQESELRETLNEAFSSGRYCPNLAPSQRRAFMVDADLEARARAAICLSITSSTWFPLRRSSTIAWVLLDTPSLEDAKKTLLSGDRTELCAAAERTPLRRLGVGHIWDAWSIFVAPPDQADMQKP